MSTQQRSHACLIAVDPSLGSILRRETLVVLEDHHHYFEDFSEFSPEAQYGLSVIFRDGFAVLDALGWPDPHESTVEVPLTVGHIDRLRRRRYDLGMANLDRLDLLDAATYTEEAAAIRSQIDTNRIAAQSLDRLFSTFTQTILA
jgi:hypothetical protein